MAKREATYREALYAARTIRAFLDGESGKWDWDDFTSCSLRDPKLDSVRRRAGAVELPPDDKQQAILRALADEADAIGAGDRPADT